ncbi:MAG TPA: hypothetical protein VM122_01690 [Usitatibacter sp.]|nr:hypothetical protein [Usitatibacter sp.]
MLWARWMAGAAIVAATLIPGVGSAQTLYAASFRSGAASGSEGIAGSLYTVNLASGSAVFVAPLRLNGTQPIGITGLAVHPQTGVFYGVTPPGSPNSPTSLVTVEPTTGRAQLVGDLRYPASDISFNRAGILFAWLPGTSQLGIVNVSNGAITPIGQPRGSGAPAGLAIDGASTAYITPSGAGGTLDTVDMATGTVKTGPQLSGAPFPSGINSLSFTPSGLLLAVNSNAGAPALTRLVTINTATGAVSTIGTLPDDTDALTFASESRREELSPVNVQTLALLVLGAIALVLGLIGWFVGRRPK